MGTNQTALSGHIQSVSLLGSSATLVWTQTATGLSITCPASMPFQTAVGFKIGPANLAKQRRPTERYFLATVGRGSAAVADRSHSRYATIATLKISSTKSRCRGLLRGFVDLHRT